MVQINANVNLINAICVYPEFTHLSTSTFLSRIDKVMLIRSVLFNFQGAFLNLVAFVCLSSLGDLIIISLSELFVKWFFKIF